MEVDAVKFGLDLVKKARRRGFTFAVERPKRRARPQTSQFRVLACASFLPSSHNSCVLPPPAKPSPAGYIATRGLCIPSHHASALSCYEQQVRATQPIIPTLAIHLPFHAATSHASPWGTWVSSRSSLCFQFGQSREVRAVRGANVWLLLPRCSTTQRSRSCGQIALAYRDFAVQH
jgi:hypothetical protein